VILESVPVGMLMCNCIIVGDEATKRAIVIDPGDEIEKISALLDKHVSPLRRSSPRTDTSTMSAASRR
jgi:hypothetical protein